MDQVYDRSTIASQATHFTRPHHRQAVETALHTLQSDHRFAPPADPMSTGHLTELDDLLTLTEFAGLHSPTAIADRLQTEGLPELATDLEALKTAFETARSSFTDTIDRSLRSERYAHVTSQTPADYLSHVDVVIVGQFSRLSPVEAELLEWLTADRPTYAISTRFTEATPTGTDRTLQDLWHTYTTRLDLTPHRVSDNTATAPPLDPTVFGRLYHPTTRDPVPVGDGVELVAPMDVGHEARHILRRVQSLVTTEAVPPGDIGIVMTDPGTYLEPLAAAAAERELPLRYTHDRDLDNTRPGAAMFDLLAFLTDPADPTALAAVLTSPCTDLTSHEPALDAITLGETLQAAIAENAVAELDADATALVTELQEQASAVAAGSIEDLQSIRQTFGLEPEDEDAASEVGAAAWETVERTIDVVTARPMLESRPHWVQALRRAFANATVSTTHGPKHASVDLVGVLDETERTFEHVYIAGLTQAHYPSGGRRLAFTRRLNEAHRDFDRTNPDQRADHRIASLITSAQTATLTRPRTREDGSEYIPAGLLQELRRHTTLKSTSVDEYDHLTSEAAPSEQIGSSSDTWRALAVLGGESRDALTTAHTSTQDVLTTYLSQDEAAARSSTVSRGVDTATSRARSKPGARNGWLESETVGLLKDDSDGAMSPSEIETYAACGFKHYASYLLDLEREDEDTTSADQGTIVHDILDEFYTTLQGEDDTPIDLSTHDPETLEAHLFEVATSVLSDVDDPDAVTDRWKRSLLAGLASDAVNPYYNPWGMAEPVAGTLASFLAEERTLRGVTDAMTEPLTTQPAYFERYLQATIDGVDLHGKVDRVDVTPDGEFVVRDYKTGYTPGADEVLDGLAFQLPVYLLLATADLEHTPLGGTYYQLAGPNNVSSYSTVLASAETAVWHKHGGSPLRRHNTPRLETQEAFTEFLTETIPERITRIIENINRGYFHPTVNDPDAAGCSYCEYSEICDVRSDRRHAFIDKLDARPEEDVYVPVAARGEEYEPTTESLDGGDA
ncbi:PD-(D/E)XK nuclease family protein [Halorubellus litoreus]|uniref:PD-(D/E)XK nuclease family protein n=1 Tax=Halorubellus litoreus TaxID=755308 RepID=A0ABD5VLL3_9EURY